MTWKPQISLRGLLLVMLFLGMATALAITSFRLQKADTELRTLRIVAGYLTIDDPTKISVLSLPADDPETWRWRIFFPKRQRYKWHAAYGNIPQLTPPTPGTAHDVTGISNEQYDTADHEALVTATLRRQDNGAWRLAVQSVDSSRQELGGVATVIPASNMQPLRDASSTDGLVLGNRDTSVVDSKGPIILLQSRACEEQPGGTYTPAPGPAPGFMIWLEHQ